MELGVSYVAAHLPQHIEADMAYLADIGCTEVLFALQENHMRVLDGALRFGPSIARRHGLRPYAVIWGLANTFGGGRMSLALLEDTSMWCRSAAGEPVPRACLNNPKLVDEFVRLAEQLRAHGYEGVFVDEPTRQECFCTYCQRAYAASGGGSLGREVGTATYDMFRGDVVANYTRNVSQRVKAIAPDLATITCVMPVDRDAWASVAEIDDLDVFGTDPYWLVSNGRMTLQDAVDDARAMKDLCVRAGKRSQIWLNCWRIPEGLEPEVYRGGRELAAVGCDSLYTWSYRGGLGTNEECDRPGVAWAQVERLYRELSEG